MKDFPQLSYYILSSSTEDYIGLYEVVWEINTRYPEHTEAEKIAAAQFTVRILLSKNWIEVFKLHWASYDEPALVPPTDYDRVLTEVANWEPPDRSGYYYGIASTQEGDSADQLGLAKDEHLD